MVNSRTADKFVIRLPEGVRDAVNDKAMKAFMSMNAFIIQAIVEKLDRSKRQELLLDALAEAVERGKRQELLDRLSTPIINS